MSGFVIAVVVVAGIYFLAALSIYLQERRDKRARIQQRIQREGKVRT